MAQQFADVRFNGVGAFSPSGAGIAYLRPDADDTDGGWTNELDGSVLFSSIDEAAPADDNDYVKSSTGPFPDICKVRLSNPSSLVATPAKIRTRYKKSGTGTINLLVRLLQGTTEIAEWSYLNISTSFVTSEETLTTPQFNAITDFNDLFLEFEANSFYIGPGDVTATGAVIWHGLRAYSNATVGNNLIRLRRDSDNAEQDFASTSTGLVDTSAIASFAGAANLFVTAIYDQVGSSTLTQATASRQPNLILNGFGTMPVIRSSDTTTTGDQLQASSSPGVNAPLTMYAVAKRTASFTTTSYIIFNPSVYLGFAASANNATCTPSITRSATDNVFHVLIHSHNTLFADGFLWVDGTKGASFSDDGNVMNANGMNFTDANNNRGLDGDTFEFGVWSSLLSDGENSDLTSNVMSFWGV